MKKGISLTTIVIAISVMMILIASVSVIGSSAINSANFEEYKSEIERVASEVNIYVTENNSLPIITSQAVYANNLGNDFVENLKENNDFSTTLYVIDISKLDDYNFEKGKGTISDKDVFVVAEGSNNVYYLKGFKYRGKVYFTY